MTRVLNVFRKYFLNRHRSKLARDIESGLLDTFLETLLKAMGLLFLIDKDFRRNIEGFNARYAFVSKDRKIATGIVFGGNKMKVFRKEIDDTNVTVIFKNGETLMNFLFNKNPDVASAVIDREVTYEGNMNYLLKFAFMAKHLQLQFAL